MILVAYAAPFAAFRELSAGYLRPSCPLPPPSALYGLLLNVAGIEMRGPLGAGPTRTRAGLPQFQIASATVKARASDHSFSALLAEQTMPGRGRLLQQLHSVPVGQTNEHRKPLTRGNKHHIAPARRELLSTVRGVCAVDAPAKLEDLLRTRVETPGETLSDGTARYGLPFLGDNNFFLEELSIIEPSREVVDWTVMLGDEVQDWQEGVFPFRLTLWADRSGMKDTVQTYFGVRSAPLDSPPPSAWVRVGPR